MRLGIFVERSRSVKKTDEEASRSVEATPQEEILLEELRRRYDLLQEEIETVNTKAGIALAFLGTLFVLVLDTVSPVLEKVDVSCWVGPAVFLTFSLYVSSTICIILAIKPHRLIAPIGIEKSEVEPYLGMTRQEMLLQLIVQYSSNTQRSLPVAKSKNRWFFAGLILAVAFTICLLVTQVLVGLL
jgi:hypothetical protein